MFTFVNVCGGGDCVCDGDGDSGVCDGDFDLVLTWVYLCIYIVVVVLNLD